MKPDSVLLADVGDRLDGVEGAKDGCAGGAVDEEGKVAFALVTNYQLLQLLGDHATAKSNN